MKEHVTWSRETGEDKCPECGSDPILIVAGSEWDVPYLDELRDTVTVAEEISAHYCLKCGKITSLSLNT